MMPNDTLKRVCALLCGIAISSSSLSAEVEASGFDADFTRPTERIILKNGAAVKDGALSLGKLRSFAEVSGSEQYDFTNGGTLMTVCRFSDLSGNPDKFRFLFFKGGSFLFGLTGGKYNFSLCHDGRWSIALIGGAPPSEGEWVHLAAVARRISDKEQGNFGFELEIYVNGERILGRFEQLRELVASKTAPVTIGSPDRNTNFNGEISAASFVPRALSPHEIGEAARKNKLVKITVRGLFEVSGELAAGLKKLESSAATPFKRFMASSLLKSAMAGASEEKTKRGMAALERLFAEKDISDEDTADKFNQLQKDFMILNAGGPALFLICGDAGHAFPAADIYDPQIGRGIFGNRANSWRFRCRSGSERHEDIYDFSEGVNTICGPVSRKNGEYVFTMTWKHPKLEVRSQAVFGRGGLRMDLNANSLSPEVLLKEAVFPQWGFAHKSGSDFLVTPRMSGLLIPSPIEDYSYERDFPCAQNNMQFQGYFSSDGDGVYAALEDPDATARSTSVCGMRKQLFVAWTTKCPYRSGETGCNSFTLGGEAVIRLYRGGWFEAGRLYKEFLVSRASWWIPRLPRLSTPEWFRNNSIWILAGVQPSRNEATLLYLREYFGQTFGVHLVGTAPRVWPHFDLTSPEGARFTKAMQSAGIRIVPYSDPRLWSEANPDGSNGWSKAALGMAIKKEDGSPFIEYYKINCLVLCPASQAWQDEYVRICAGIAAQGFDGIYHDQLPCGHSTVCFDPKHGHMSNDPSIWIRRGYAVMYDRLHKSSGKRWPDLAHTGEDASDPYLKMVDGYTCWRWTEPHAVPLFQSIYAGRAQFTGKLYNHQYPGDWESNFAKAASQVVNAEQLGWLTLEDLEAATPFRKYFKTLAWLRRALLEYFNTAERMPPVEFKNGPGRMFSVWGNTGVAGLKVDSDIIQHSVWQLSDRRVMALFLNTTDTPQQAEVEWPYCGKFFMTASPASAIPRRVMSAPALGLPPYGMEVWLISESDNTAEAQSIAGALNETAAFDEGRTLNMRSFFRQEVPAVLSVLAKKLNPVETAKVYTNAFRRYFANGIDKDSVLILYDGSELRYAGLDFQKPCSELRIIAAFTSSEEGGLFEIICGNEKLGEAVLKKGGRYLDFQEIPVKLTRSLTGECRDMKIVFRGQSCRFKGWTAL